ncbi:F-box protein SKIP23 [Linum grandiflorum]
MAQCSNDLTGDLVDGIISLLDTDIDILRSGSLCRSWRNSAVRRARSLPAGHQVLSGNGIGIMEPVHLFKHSIHLVGGGDQDQCRWLVKVADRKRDPVGKRILNPLSESPFRLDSLPWNFPSVLAMRRFRIKELHHVYVVHVNQYYGKVAVSWSSEMSNEFVLLTLKGGKLAKYYSAEQKWTVLAECRSFLDVIVHKGELLAVDGSGRVVIVAKEDNNGTKSLIVAATGSPKFVAHEKYLVQSVDGELLLVEKFDLNFKVYKLNEEEKIWVEVEELGDNVLFLGDNSVFAASSSSDLCNVRNCIFFSDNLRARRLVEDEIVDAFSGMYVFDFARKDVTPLTKCPIYSKLFWPPPPSLCMPAYDYDNID